MRYLLDFRLRQFSLLSLLLFVIVGCNIISPIMAHAATGFPDATNTGVAGCPALTTHNGDITASTNGQVIQNMVINGDIDVEADNVTIKCVKLNKQGNASNFTPFAINASNATGTIISHVELNGNDVYGPNAEVQGSDYTAEYVDVHNAEDGWHVGGNTRITDSYCHDMLYADGADGPTHSDCIQAFGYGGANYSNPVSNITISHNTIKPWEGHAYIGQCPSSGCQHANSAIFLKTDFGKIDNVFIDDNLMYNGTYTIYSVTGNCDACGPPTNVRITNNRFGFRSYEYALSDVDTGATWAPSNVWDDTGTYADPGAKDTRDTSGGVVGGGGTGSTTTYHSADLANLLSNYGRTSGMTKANGDLNNDGAVNIYDLSKLLADYSP